MNKDQLNYEKPLTQDKVPTDRKNDAEKDTLKEEGLNHSALEELLGKSLLLNSDFFSEFFEDEADMEIADPQSGGNINSSEDIIEDNGGISTEEVLQEENLDFSMSVENVKVQSEASMVKAELKQYMDSRMKCKTWVNRLDLIKNKHKSLSKALVMRKFDTAFSTEENTIMKNWRKIRFLDFKMSIHISGISKKTGVGNAGIRKVQETTPFFNRLRENFTKNMEQEAHKNQLSESALKKSKLFYIGKQLNYADKINIGAELIGNGKKNKIDRMAMNIGSFGNLGFEQKYLEFGRKKKEGIMDLEKL